METLTDVRERCSNVSDVGRQLRQSWDDRIKFPPTEILECYSRGCLAVLVDLSCEFGGERSTASIHVSRDLSGNMARKVFNFPRCSDYGQFAMFVGNVHAMDDTSRIIRRINSVVRLKVSDELECLGTPHTLYLSVVSGEFVFKGWPRLKDGKFDISRIGGLPTNVVGQLPNNMIQAGPEMVDCFPTEHAESQRDRQCLEILNSLQELLVAELWQDRVVAFLKEPGNLRLEIQDVLIGPF